MGKEGRQGAAASKQIKNDLVERKGILHTGRCEVGVPAPAPKAIEDSIVEIAGLFAGIGGFELGMNAAGHRSSLLVENWAPARSVLEHRFPHSDLHTDVKTLTSLPSATELVLAGFPCQDLSQAGLTAGIGGTRSALVGEVFRLLDRRRVPWVVLENVSFMLHLAGGNALGLILEALEERGYRWAYRIVNSISFQPQRRERIFIAATNGDGDPADVLLVDEVEPRISPTRLGDLAHGFYWTEGTRGLGWAVDAVPTLKNGSTVGIPSPPAILLPNGNVITPDIRDAERLQGFPSDWTLASEEVARASIRWSLIGNAVTVDVAKWLGYRLMEPGRYECSRDRDMPANGKWPKSARFDGRNRYAVDLGASPDWTCRAPLHRFLYFGGKPLSSRATRGFLSRARASSLRFPESFLDLVSAHLKRMDRGEELHRVTESTAKKPLLPGEFAL